MLKLTAIVSLVALSLAACNSEGGSAPAGSAGGSAKPAHSSAPAPAKSTAPPAATPAAATAKPAEDKLVEYDLSIVGDKWKGYTAQLPREGAKVMADGVDGARLATNGREDNPFDIAWAPGKGNLKDLKKGLEAAGKDGKVKTAFQQDTADGVEYTNTYEGGTKSYNFDLVMKVGKADFHCYTLPMGVADEAQFKKHKDACKTLAKK